MKQSIQKHDISNLSPLAPALRGLEDARTQRWTFCKPCSMEQNVQVQGEDCQHGMTIEHVWENAKCQNTELPRPRGWQWAWIENLMQRQHFQARSLNTAKMTHDKFIVKKKKHTNATETVNTARLHDQWNGPLSTCSLKRVWHARNPQPSGKTRKTYIWLQYSIFLIKDPRNSQNEFWGSQSGHFRAKLKAKKCQRINIENFKFSIFELGPGNAKYEPRDRHGKRPNEFWKPLNEYFRTM